MKWTHLPIRSIFAGAAVVLPQLGLATQLFVGQVAPLTGLDANQGRAYSAGMQLLFDSVNKAGGVNGHTFALVRKDDGGRADDTVKETQKLLVESKPLVLAGYFGNKNIADLVASGLLERERIPLVGYRVTEIRPETPMLFSVRAGLSQEIHKLTEHLATIGISRLGVFYEEGPGTSALLATVDEAAKKTGATIAAKASYPAGTTRVSAAVDRLLAAAPQAIIMVASAAATAGFIEQFRASGGKSQLFAHSGADIEQLAKRLAEEQMQGVAIAQVTPSPYKISSKLTKELIDSAAAKDKLDAPLSYAMMEGYIAAKVIVEAVRRQGARPSREGMVSAMETIDNYNLGGYVVGYKPGMRTGSKMVELSIITSEGRIRQ